VVIEAGLDSLAGGQLFFTVWDKGTFSKDDLIGETQVPIVQFVRFQDYQKAGGAVDKKMLAAAPRELPSQIETRCSLYTTTAHRPSPARLLTWKAAVLLVPVPAAAPVVRPCRTWAGRSLKGQSAVRGASYASS